MRARDSQADELNAHLPSEQAAVQEQYLLLRPLRYVAAVCGLAAFAVAAAALVGRFTGNFMLASYDEGYKVMVPAVGLCLALLAAAVTLLALRPRTSQTWLPVLGGTVIVIVGLRLVEFAFGTDWGSSKLFLTPPWLPRAPEELPYALPTAAALFAAGWLLVLLTRPGARVLEFILASIVTTVGAAFLLGYAYGQPLVYGHALIPLALPAAISMFLVGLGVTIVMTAQALAVQRLIGIRRVEDQLERQRLTAEAQRRAAELETTIRTIPDGVVILDRAGRPVRQNDAAVRLFEWSDEEQALPWVERVAGREPRTPAGEHIPVEHLPTARSLRGEAVSNVVFCIRCDAQEETWLLVNSAPLRSEDGTLTGSVATFVDITELQRAQRQAWQRADELDTAIEAMTDGVVVYAADGTIVRTNQAAMMSQHLAETDRHTALPERVRDMVILDLEGQPVPLDHLPTARALRGEIVQREVTHVEQVDGSWRWYATSAAPLRDPSGAVSGAVTTFRDITSERGAEEAVADSEARYRKIGELLPFGVWMSNPDGTNRHVSQSFLNLLGMDRQQYEATPFENLVHPDDLPVSEALFPVIQDSPADTPWSQEFRLRGADGQWHWILARGVRAFDSQGKFTGYLGVNIDIQELKEAQQMAQRHAAEVETLFASMADGVTVYGPDGRVLKANDAVSRILCFDAEQSLLPWDQRLRLIEPRLLSGEPLPPECAPGVRAAAGETVADFPLLVRRGDGRDLWVSLSAAPVRDTNGEVTSVIVTFRDISPLMAAQQEAERRAAELNTVIDAIPDGVLIYDRDGVVTRANAAARATSQYTAVGLELPLAERVSAYGLSDLDGNPVPPEEAAGARALRGETVVGQTYRLCAGTEREKTMITSAAPLRDTQGAVIGAVAATTDITEMVSAQRERERLAAELATSEERYRAIGELLPHGVWASDAEGQLTYVSQNMLEFLGITFEEYVGSGWARLCHPDDAQPTLDAWMAASHSGVGLWSYECRLRGKDGQYHWVLTRGVALRDADGVITSWVGTNTDIDAVKAAQAEREELAERLSALVEVMPAGVLICDAAGQFTLINQRMRDMMGITVTGDASGPTTGYTLHHPDGSPYEPEELPLVQALRQDRTISDAEMVFHTATGARVHTLASACPLRDREGDVIGAVAVIRDITALHLAQEELRQHRDHLEDLVVQRAAELAQSEFRYREFVRTANSAIVQYDQDGTITLVNEYAERLFGYEPGELLGQQVMKLVPVVEEETGRSLEGLKDAVLADPVGFETSENENVTKDGRRLWMIWSNRAVQDENGDLRGVMAVGVDRTAHRGAEKELLRLNRVYSVLSRANEAIISARTREELFHEICRVAVEDGRFRMAWIGMLDADRVAVVPLAQWGHEDGYLSDIRVSVEVSPEGSGPTGTAVREGRYQVCNDIVSDPRMAPWAEPAARRGYRSSGAFPFQVGSAIGALTIYSDELGFFDQQRVHLLQTLAINLSIALEREEAERGLLAYQDQLRQLASELPLAEERERRRIAASIHDDLIQNLAFAKMKLALTRQTNQVPEVAEGLDGVGALLDDAIQYTRGLTFEMSLPILYQLGFEPALEWLVEHMEQRHGYTVRLETHGELRALSPDVRVTLFQAVRELLTNVAKHAHAEQVVVSLWWRDDCLEVAVLDDGVGFSVETAGSGFGVFHIQESLKYLGGSLEVGSAPGAGAKFTLIMPLAPE